MPLLMRHESPSCLWGIWEVSETIGQLLALVPRPDECQRETEHFASPKRRTEWTATRVLLATLAGPQARIAHEPSGKPYLADGSDTISISHTNGYAAVILGRNAQTVGIDIEQYGERIDRLTHMFMNGQEKALPYQGKATWSHLLHWSAKETMFKCMDTPETDFKAHLHIRTFQPQASGTIHAFEDKTELRRHFDIHYLLHPRFVLTWTC